MELMDLIVRATNAIIGVVSVVGLTLFTLGQVWLARQVLLAIEGLFYWKLSTGFSRSKYISELVLAVAGMVALVLWIT